MQVIIFFLLWVAFAARAEQIRDPNFESLAREAFALYPIKTDFVSPTVERISKKELEEWICGGEHKCGNISVMGVYHEGTIYLTSEIVKWDDWDKGLYIHEVVHFLQEITGKDKQFYESLCTKHLKLELEAYNIQNQWLNKRGKMIKEQDIQELTQRSAYTVCTKSRESFEK